MLPRSRTTRPPPPTSASPSIIPEPRGAWLRPLDTDVESLTHVRGTLIVASREQMKVLGEYERYLSALSPQANVALVSLIAASWVPVELAVAHFEAIDKLELDTDVIEAATGAVAAKLHGVLLRTVAKAAQATGVTPLSVVRTLGTLWGRTFRGGAVGVKQTAPKEGTVFVVGSPLLSSRYHRTGIRVHIQVAADLFSERAFVREQSYKPAHEELAIRVQWV